MPRRPLGERPLTGAEREARRREKAALKAAAQRQMWERVLAAMTIREAREIAQAALDEMKT